jgi:hypothetical protein
VTAPARTAERGNGAAIAGFVCALFGLAFSLVPPFFILVVPGLLDALGIAFAARGRRRAAAGARHGGLATAGLVVGILGLVVFIGWWTLFAIGVSRDGESPSATVLLP